MTQASIDVWRWPNHTAAKGQAVTLADALGQIKDAPKATQDAAAKLAAIRSETLATLAKLQAQGGLWGDKAIKDAKRNGKAKEKRHKAKLPAIAFSTAKTQQGQNEKGKPTQRGNENAIAHTGLLCLDVDGLESPSAAIELRGKLVSDHGACAAFLSPSKHGVKALLLLDPVPQPNAQPPEEGLPPVHDWPQHEAAFDAAQAYFKAHGIDIDRACRDVSRLCYASYDPDLAANAHATPFKWQEQAKEETTGQDPQGNEEGNEEGNERAKERTLPPFQWAAQIDLSKRPQTILAAHGHFDAPLLTPGLVAVLAAAGGSGKSRLALQIALGMAAAETDGDATPDGLWQVAAGRVLVATFEDDHYWSGLRLAAQARTLGCTRALDRIAIWRPQDPMYGPQPGGEDDRAFYNTRPGPLGGMGDLETLMREIRPRLVVVDPALAAFCGNSNEPAGVREFIQYLAERTRRIGAAVLLVAHSSKAGRGAGAGASKSKGDSADVDDGKLRDAIFDPAKIGGATAWVDGARAALVLSEPLSGGDRFLAIAKANYAPSHTAIRLAYHDQAWRPNNGPWAHWESWLGDGREESATDASKSNGKAKAKGINSNV